MPRPGAIGPAILARLAYPYPITPACNKWAGPDAEGHQAWSLSRLTIADVTHGPCRAGRYRPLGDSGSCSPEQADQTAFPLPLGDEPLAVEGCDMKEYAVLIVFGVPVDSPEEN